MKSKSTNSSQATFTRSISFDPETFARIEVRRAALRLDRSTFLRYVLEDYFGIIKRPLLDQAKND